MKWERVGGTHGIWQLTRFAEHIASVERLWPDLASPAQYQAEVIDPRHTFGNWTIDQFRACPTLFPSLKDAQLWCEREVRLMEVGELM